LCAPNRNIATRQPRVDQRRCAVSNTPARPF
jgi:hypothetical protein